MVNQIKNVVAGHSSVDLKKEKAIEPVEENKGHDPKYIWCSKCRHGGHLEHLKEWFTELMICPVADCGCICLEFNHIIM